MINYPSFDVEILIDLQGRAFRWPDPEEVRDERSPGCNREYKDLRSLEPDEIERIYDLEGEIIERLQAAPGDPDDEYETILDELSENFDPGLYGLDLGVALTVAALLSAGCIPFSSCNAGAFGGFHHERHPLVAFFAQQVASSLLATCAEESEVGLEVEDTGALIVYAGDIRAMRRFAEAVRGRAEEFPA